MQNTNPGNSKEVWNNQKKNKTMYIIRVIFKVSYSNKMRILNLFQNFMESLRDFETIIV